MSRKKEENEKEEIDEMKGRIVKMGADIFYRHEVIIMCVTFLKKNTV